MSFYHIPTFTRFQWINNPRIVTLLLQALPYAGTGRRGHGQALLFRYLMYKHLMDCTYRDLESVSDIDYSTFIKFRQKIKAHGWVEYIFQTIAHALAEEGNLTLILDSSFVEQYARHTEEGAEYSGFKKKIGFKLHEIIDFKTRLPVAQTITGGARADVVLGEYLVQTLPAQWPVKSFLADKGYDSTAFVQQIHQQWPGVKVGIPVRKTNQAALKSTHQETEKNRRAKEANRTLTPTFYNRRTEIERYFSRKKYVFNLGCERTRGLKNFEANCLMTSVMEQLEYLSSPA